MSFYQLMMQLDICGYCFNPLHVMCRIIVQDLDISAFDISQILLAYDIDELTFKQLIEFFTLSKRQMKWFPHQAPSVGILGKRFIGRPFTQKLIEFDTKRPCALLLLHKKYPNAVKSSKNPLQFIQWLLARTKIKLPLCPEKLTKYVEELSNLEIDICNHNTFVN